MPFITVKDFNLKYTLECGQFFRWFKREGVYYVQHNKYFFSVLQDSDKLIYDGIDRNALVKFFSLDQDLHKILSSFNKDRHIGRAINIYWGLRLIRQDPWECTLSFILSAASNIPRITKNLEDTARIFGKKVSLGDVQCYTLPRPGSIKDEKRMRAEKLGFRSKFIVAAEKLAENDFLEKVKKLPYEEAKELIMEIPGVAEKVADCILLFAYGHLEAFPVDTWIRKVMTQLYFGGEKTKDKKIREFALEYFGKYAGYAQEYLYVYTRQNWKQISQKHARILPQATKQQPILNAI